MEREAVWRGGFYTDKQPMEEELSDFSSPWSYTKDAASHSYFCFPKRQGKATHRSMYSAI